METVTGVEEGEIVTVALAERVVSYALVAFTVTEPPEGTATGAVYRPVLEMVPTVELPPWTPFTDQSADVLVVPVTVAVNC